MLNIKKLLTKILEWIKSPLIVNSTGETFYVAKRSDYDVSVGVGVGNGGTNHGVYSYKITKNDVNQLTADTPAAWIVYRDKKGNIGLGGTLFNNLFISTEHTLTSNLTITNGNTSNSTYTVTKSGYTPVGVVGWRTINGSGSGGSYAVCFGATLSSASSGSGTVNIGIRAIGAVTKCTLLATVLWIKNI